ncbi:hypothetical protein [Ancylobacter sp. IITR112]|uniref:hypothetical protein n=1 Tax=Ancylobacter sp. IITR112 TaxID=3138073 RepID=UPI00352B136E
MLGEGLVITRRRLLPPVITIDAGAATGGYAGSLYHADQPGGVWQADGVDLPGETAQDWTMTLELEGRAIRYRVGERVSNAIQMWTPAGLDGLVGAFDVRQGLYLDSGRLYGWSPIAGGMYYTQPSTALRPLYQATGADGRPTIYLDFDRRLSVGGLSAAPAARSIVGLLSPRPNDWFNWTAIISDSNVTGWGLFKSWASPATQYGTRVLGILTAGFANLQESSRLIVDGETYLVAAKTARPAGTYGFRINGAAAGGGTSSVAAFSGTGSYTVNGFGGLSSHVIADAYLSDADLARIEGWVAWTLGDAGRMDAGNPYKSAAPRSQ